MDNLAEHQLIHINYLLVIKIIRNILRKKNHIKNELDNEKKIIVFIIKLIITMNQTKEQ